MQVVVGDDSELVGLIGKYVGAALFDVDESETFVARAVRCDERKGVKYCEAICVLAVQAVIGQWVAPPPSFISGSEVAKDNRMLGHALMDLVAPGEPELLFGVGGMSSAHSAKKRRFLKANSGRKR